VGNLVSVGEGVAYRTGQESAFCSAHAPRLSGAEAVAQLLAATGLALPISHET